MGSHVAKPSNKSMVDRLVERSYFIQTPEVEGVFRAVDRAMYFEIEEGESTDPYEDDPWKRGNLHISAPCIYARVVGALKLESGMSFLNMGSGTGYLNTLIGLLIGPNGVNHGIELHGDVVEYAYKKLEQFKAKSRALDKYNFSEPIFIKGNCLNLNPNLRYDRIYLGAACLLDMEENIKRLVKPNGGILVMPFGNRLMRHTRVSENEWKTESLMEVNFTQMIGQGEDTTMIDMPKPSAKKLKDLCRIAIRQHLREKTDVLYPNLLNSDNIDHRRARRLKASKCIQMLKAKKQAGSAESNNNICSMSSSSSMSRDKNRCHCSNAWAGQSRSRDNNSSRPDEQGANRNGGGRQSINRNNSAMLERCDISQSIINDRTMAARTAGEVKPASGSRVMTRSASKLLSANTDTNNRAAGNSSTNDSQVTQSSSGTSSSRACDEGSDANPTLPSRISNNSNQGARALHFRPNSGSNSNSNNTRDQYRKSAASSSDSTVGESSDVEEYNEDYDNLNISGGSRYSNHCARTRPYKARSGHQSDAFSGIVMGALSRGAGSRRRHSSQLRLAATLSEPESDSMDSDNMSPLREPWCVARQLRTHRARFLHLRRIANSGDDPIGRINIDVTPSTSESSFADLILGDDCISSGDDSWDNSTSATSEFDDSFSNDGDDFDDEDDDFNDDDGDDSNGGNKVCASIRGLNGNIADEVYHDDANDVDGILEDSVLANSIESQSSSSPSSSSSESDSPSGCGDVLSTSHHDRGQQAGQGTSASSMMCPDRLNRSRHQSSSMKPCCNDEPVARRLRSRGLELPSKLLAVDDTSENPESSASGRSDHETTAAGAEQSSARTRPIVPVPSTSLAGSSMHQSRSSKHMLSNGKRSSQASANNNNSRSGAMSSNNCARVNHRNHSHCRRHCKEARCPASNTDPMQSTSSSSLPPQPGSAHRPHTCTPSASSTRQLTIISPIGGAVEDVDLTSSSESVNNTAATNNDHASVGTQSIERKRKRRSSSESSEMSNEVSPCWQTATSACHGRATASRSKRCPRRRVPNRRCSCSQRYSNSSRPEHGTDQGNYIVMSDASANRAALNEDQSGPRRSMTTGASRNDESSDLPAGRGPFRTRFLLHNTWSHMLHREIPTLDVLTRLSLRAADPLGRLHPLQSGSAVSCLASFWPQVSSQSCNAQRPTSGHSDNNPAPNNRPSRLAPGGIGLISSSSGSDIANRMNRGSRPVSSAMEPSDGGNSSAQQAPRRRVNCCCCRYCRNVRRSRRERKQQLHHQSRRGDEFDTRHRSSCRRPGRRRRETESEKYYTHMSDYIRRLPVPKVLHEYLNLDRGF